MVWSTAQTSAFFTGDTQMAIPTATIKHLRNEGITSVDDLNEFDKDAIEAVAANFRKASPMIVLGAKSIGRLIIATDLAKFYETISRTPTEANMKWDPVMRNFNLQMKALREVKKRDDPETPKISKSLPIMRWAESFRDILHRVLGVRTIPLAYVIRPDVIPVGILPPLEPNMPHSIVDDGVGTIVKDLINRASHSHPNYTNDNDKVYGMLEEATRGTSYSPSIKPFQRNRDGRGAYLALVSQYAGQDKWNLEIEKCDDILHNQKWKGTGNFPLESFCAKHRNAMEQLRLAAAHVPYQLPTEFTRVGYLLDGIETCDPRLQAALSTVRADNDVTTGEPKRYNFNKTVTFITPEDPVTRRLSKGKRVHADVASIGFNQSDGRRFKREISSLRSGKGKTGVDFRWHKPEEYKHLTTSQKSELYTWRNTP